MPSKKEASEKQQSAEGVAVNPPRTEDRYAEHGLPVSVPTEKSGHSDTTQKEN